MYLSQFSWHFCGHFQIRTEQKGIESLTANILAEVKPGHTQPSLFQSSVPRSSVCAFCYKASTYGAIVPGF